MKNYKKIELYQEAIKFELLEDYREAFNLYCDSAKLGYAKAQLAVAKFYLGEGIYKGIIKSDKKKAIEFLKQAESGGNAEAKYRFALILLSYKNKAETEQALDLLQDASDRKYSLATLELAKCSYYGIGCPVNYIKALELLGQIMYASDELAQRQCENEIKKIFEGFKSLIAENNEWVKFSEDDLCLFKDICNDLNIED